MNQADWDELIDFVVRSTVVVALMYALLLGVS